VTTTRPTGAAPTLDEVALDAGVSRSTASRAINGGERVSPEAQAAVDAAVERLGYSPNRAARSLVTRRTGSIALVIPEPDGRVLADPFLSGTLRGTSHALDPTELQLVLLVARPGDHAERIARYLAGGHVDGAIVASHHSGDELETSVQTAHLPAVFIGRPNIGADSLVWVDLDNLAAGRTATERLVAAGRRRVATIAGPLDMAAGRDRLAGWRTALHAAGLADDACVPGDFTLDGGAAAMRRLLDEHPDVDAVFAASDLMAQGALRVLHESGRSVPGDVAVVGFDDLGVAASTDPALTTMRNPVEQMVRTATNVLLDELEGRGRATRPILYPAELVERASVAG
jgi:DNA-binding LacI/PurR family transcriptional regulator